MVISKELVRHSVKAAACAGAVAIPLHGFFTDGANYGPARKCLFVAVLVCHVIWAASNAYMAVRQVRKDREARVRDVMES